MEGSEPTNLDAISEITYCVAEGTRLAVIFRSKFDRVEIDNEQCCDHQLNRSNECVTIHDYSHHAPNTKEIHPNREGKAGEKPHKAEKPDTRD